MNEQKLLTREQISSRQRTAMWMLALYLVLSVFMPAIFRKVIFIPIPGDFLWVIQIALWRVVLWLILMLPLVGCCRLLSTLGDDAGRIFIHRWMWSAIVGFIVVCLHSLVIILALAFSEDESLFHIVGESLFGNLFLLVPLLCCVLYALSGLFLLAENHPKWTKDLIYVGLVLFFPYLLRLMTLGLRSSEISAFSVLFSFVAAGLAVLAFIILKKLILSEVFTPNNENREGTAVQHPFVTPTMIGVLGSFALVAIYMIIFNIS